MPDPRDHDSHLQVYGQPDRGRYDGIHMHGPSGRKIFQECILNTLEKAGLISPKLKSTSLETSSSQPQYDPLKMFKDRLIYQKQKPNTHGTASRQQKPSVISSGLHDAPAGHPSPSVVSSGLHDDPAGHPRPSVIGSRLHDAPAGHPRPSTFGSRPSVIGSCSLQDGYFVPVSNQFDILGN